MSSNSRISRWCGPKGPPLPPIEDLFALHRLLVKVHVEETVPAGRYNFRIKTPLGSTNTGSFYVGSLSWSERPSPTVRPPNLIKSSIRRPWWEPLPGQGDEDVFEFDVEAGKTLVFEVQASVIGSLLDSELAILDNRAAVLARNKDFSGRPRLLPIAHIH